MGRPRRRWLDNNRQVIIWNDNWRLLRRLAHVYVAMFSKGERKNQHNYIM